MALRCFAARTSISLRIPFSSSALRPALSFPFFRGFSTVTTTEGFKFAHSHEWVKVEGDTGTIGISDHAQEELGDVVYVELPVPGDHVTKGATFGVVESVKAASDVYSPVSGEILEVNEQLKSSPALINSGPQSEGWILKVRLKDASELSHLLDAKQYQQHIASNTHE